jgi:single-strand DNA-binding protein
MPLPTITMEGRLTADPELRFTPSGAAVTNFTLAANDRVKDGDEWKDGEALFLRCSCWKQLAENVAESTRKGDLVIVTGKLGQRSYETREGEKRTVVELKAFTVAASLQFRTIRHGEGRAERGAESAPAEDPWATPSGAGDPEPPF